MEAGVSLTIGTVPQDYLPTITIRALCNVGIYAYELSDVAYINVSSSTGKINVLPPKTGTFTVYCSLSWITD